MLSFLYNSAFPTKPEKPAPKKSGFSPTQFSESDFTFTDDLLLIAVRLVNLLTYFEKNIKISTFHQRSRSLDSDLGLFFTQKKSDPQLRPDVYVHLRWLSIAIREHKYEIQPDFIPFEFDTDPSSSQDQVGVNEEDDISEEETYGGVIFDDMMADLQWLRELRAAVPNHLSLLDPCFLERQLLFYKKFLFCLKLQTAQYVSGPHVGVDLMWHAHLLSPHYNSDCLRFGFLLPPIHQPLKTMSERYATQTRFPVMSQFQHIFGERIEASLLFVEEYPVDPLSLLLEDTFNYVLSYLDFDDVSMCRLVSRKWREAVECSTWSSYYFHKLVKLEASSSLLRGGTPVLSDTKLVEPSVINHPLPLNFESNLERLTLLQKKYENIFPFNFRWQNLIEFLDDRREVSLMNSINDPISQNSRLGRSPCKGKRSWFLWYLDSLKFGDLRGRRIFIQPESFPKKTACACCLA